MSPIGSRVAAGGLGLARFLVCFVPIDWLLFLGRLSAPVLYALLPRLRGALLDNARHILGTCSTPARQRSLAIGVLASFSRFTLEVLGAHRRLPTDEALFATMQGRNHYQRAKEAGNGIIGITLHIGNYEAGPLLLTRIHQPVAIVYNRDPTRVFEEVRSRRRRDHDLVEIPIDGSTLFGVEVLSVLRQQGMVLLAGDIGFEESGMRGVLYDFLGEKAPFLTWPAHLSMASRAPLLPCFVIRDATERYRLEICEPIFPDDLDVDAIMKRVIRVFEHYVRAYPRQWLITHRYWPDPE